MTSKFITVSLLSVASLLPQSIPVRPAVYTTTEDSRQVEMTPVVQHRRYHRRHRVRRAAVRIGVGAAGGAAVGAAVAGGPGAVVGAVAGAGAGAIYDHHERRKGN
jgi:outer membrane lipoprotein SlyB